MTNPMTNSMPFLAKHSFRLELPRHVAVQAAKAQLLTLPKKLIKQKGKQKPAA